MEDGTYRTRRFTIAVEAFLRAMVNDDVAGVVQVCAPSPAHTITLKPVLPCVLLCARGHVCFAAKVNGCERINVDTVMLSICLEEGLSNARKYHEPGSQIVIRATLEAASA